MYAVLASCIVLAITLYIINSVTKPKKFPPGPKWYPFLGSSVYLNKEIKNHGSQWKALECIAKQYSTNILGLKLGHELVITVYGIDLIKEVSNRKEFDGRPDTFFNRLRTFGKRLGITFTDGPEWKTHRNFTSKYLRDQGIGKREMETEIKNELQCIIDIIDKNCNVPLNTRTIISRSLMNMLWKIVAGEQISDENLNQFFKSMSMRSKLFNMAGGLLNEFPWIRFILPERSGYAVIKRMNSHLLEIIEDSIKKHLNKTIPGDDYIYAYLEEMGKNEYFSYDQLKAVCVDLMIATAQTTSSTLHFAFIMLITYEHIQEKIYQEIKETLGQDKISASDSARLVYTSAFLQEVQRFYTIAPISGPRKALCNTELDGYLIPKGATILIPLGTLHTDPTLWDEPDKFNPERFIKDGKLIQSDHLFPFGIGRRRCPGMTLARPFLVIVFVGLMRKFKIYSEVPPSLEPIAGMLTEPKQFTAKFMRR